ncbi:UNVERIFIED_CONTAM: hypothetical protein Sangu_0824200 [Sesamum angustifolium]|uniref:Uncharacterized protein n=1 Tax=Sesamum angustifolium TaxID=2727405 RepID=A0AAW2PW84_9LAMI
MDFNLDGDFGKIPSFNMDISDLDISLPLKKNGKSKEKPEESSTGKDKGKNDRFAFAFDFDELENFSFESSLTKEEPKAQKDKNNKGGSPNGSGCQDKEGSMHMNLLEHNRHLLLRTLHLIKQKAFRRQQLLPGSYQKISPSEKLIFPEPVDFQASTGNDVMQDLSSDSLSKNEPGGGNSSDVVDFMDTKATGSSGEKEKNTDERSNAGSTSNYKHRTSDNSEPLQTFAISETDDGAKSPVVVEDHVRGNRERTEPGQANSLVAKSRTTTAVPGISCDTPSGREKQEPASEICKLPLVSQPADLSEKGAEKRSEPLVTCSRYFSQSEKTEYPVQKASNQTTFSSLSSKKKMDLSLPSLVQGRNEVRKAARVQRLVVTCLALLGCRLGKKINDSSTSESIDMVKNKICYEEKRNKYRKSRYSEEDAAGIIALHPSKRLSQSPNSIRKFVETSEKVLDKKVSNHNSMEDAGIKSSISNCQISTPHIPHGVKIKGFEMPFSIENGGNIKKAEAYGKELDDLCNMLRKRHGEAKELLVRAVVNSNKLLLLNNPLSEEKISFKPSTM